MKNKYEINMCEGSVVKNILLFALPLALSGILQLLYNAADVMVVGQFAGNNSLAAVGSTGSLVNLIQNLFIGLSVGVNVIMAKAFGAGDRKRISNAAHTAVALGFVSGVAVLIIGALLSKQMLMLMDSPEDVIDLATLYLRIFFIGAPANMVYNFGSAILRAMGDTRRPLYFLMISGMVNVILNLVFVIVFKMDVAGVALATITSQFISAAFVMNCLIRMDGMIKLKKLKIHKPEFFEILKKGIPAGIQSTMFSISNVIIQSSINSFGSVIMAGNAAAANIEGFAYVAMNSFCNAMVTYNGQNLGGGSIKRIKKGMPIALGLVFAVGIAVSMLIILSQDLLLGLYSADAAVIEMGKVRLKYVCATYFLCGMMEVVMGAIRGLGYSVVPMIISMLGACAFRIVWIYTVFAANRTCGVLFTSYPVSWILTTLALMVYYVFVTKKVFKKLGGTVNGKNTVNA